MEPDASALTQDVAESLPKSGTPPVRMIGGDTTPAPVDKDIFDKHRQLVQWVLANDGYLNPGAQIAFTVRKGFHVIAAGEGATLAKESRIASCPMSATMSVLNALSVQPFSDHGVTFPEPFLRSQSTQTESLQAFYLMEQLILGESSWWAPYLATLPSVEEVDTMQYEEEADTKWLEGTNLRGGVSAQTTKWKEMYLQGSGQLRQLGWANALNGSYTWYVWPPRPVSRLTHTRSLGQSSAGRLPCSAAGPSLRRS
jgi:hypothetical protein